MAQGRGSATIRCLALAGSLLAVCFLFGAADAATHRVDWSFNADSWSRSKNFRAGDILEFNYDSSVHNVVAVDAAGYYGCSSSGRVYGSGSDRIMLSAGTNYFICSLNGHCGMGMKMAVNAS